MNMDPHALADAILAYAERLRAEALALPEVKDQIASGLFADVIALMDAVKRIEKRERARQV